MQYRWDLRRIMPALEFVLKAYKSSIFTEVMSIFATFCTMVPVQSVLSSRKPTHMLKVILRSSISK